MGSDIPIYFELSWSILSSICLFECLISIAVIKLYGKSSVMLVPLVVSIAGAIANGLCYYAYYSDYEATGRLVAAAFADYFWLIQEAGLSVYSYQILQNILQGRRLKIYFSLYWSILFVVVIIRTLICVNRIQLLKGDNSKIETINDFHSAYFTCIAIVELINAYFLIETFGQKTAFRSAEFFNIILKSSEFRLACLFLIGLSRAITYSFQASAQSASNVPGQLDRFVYTLECLYPFAMIVDNLVGKISAKNITAINSCSAKSKPANGKASIIASATAEEC